MHADQSRANETSSSGARLYVSTGDECTFTGHFLSSFCFKNVIKTCTANQNADMLRAHNASQSECWATGTNQNREALCKFLTSYLLQHNVNKINCIYWDMEVR